MGFISNVKHGINSMRVGSQVIKAGLDMGINSKGKGGGALLSEIARMLQPQWSEPPERDTYEWLKVFSSSPRLDPVSKIAEDVASSEWGLFTKNKDGELDKIEDHPLIELFNKPNPLPETTWFSMLYLTEAYLYLAGEAFWVVERNGLNDITEMWILPPNWVYSTPSATQDYFEVQTKDGGRIIVPPEDMIYFKEPNLVSPYGRGVGRAKAIEDEVETDEYMAQWAKKFFYNDATPPFVINAPGASKTDSERIQESWMQRFGGMQNAHKPAVLPFEGNVTTLGSDAREMDFVQSRKYLRDQANQHFRVPPELMGIIENSNRATIDAADYIYRSSVLVNRLTMIEQVIQNQIIDRYYPNHNVHFHFDNVIPDDKEFELKKSNEGLSRGALSIDEWRQANGYDPLEGGQGEVFLIPNTHTPVKFAIEAQELMRPEPPPEDPNKPKDDEEETPQTKPKPTEEVEEPADREERTVKKSMESVNWKDGITQDQEDEFGEVFINIADEQEKEMARLLNSFLKAQGKRFAKHVEGLDIKSVIEIVTKDEGDDFTEDDIIEAENRSDEIVDSFDWLDEQGKLHEAMTPEMLAASQAGNALVNDIFQLNIAFNLIRGEMLHYISTLGLQQVVNITNTTMKLLRGVVKQGILNGHGSAKIAKSIREAASEYSYRRSFVIARTETHNSMVSGKFKTYEKAGVPKKGWLTVMDGRERESHHNINGEVVLRDEKFSNGLMHPGDPEGSAEEIIQCRCALLPKFK